MNPTGRTIRRALTIGAAVVLAVGPGSFQRPSMASSRAAALEPSPPPPQDLAEWVVRTVACRHTAYVQAAIAASACVRSGWSGADDCLDACVEPSWAACAEGCGVPRSVAASCRAEVRPRLNEGLDGCDALAPSS